MVEVDLFQELLAMHAWLHYRTHVAAVKSSDANIRKLVVIADPALTRTRRDCCSVLGLHRPL